MWNRILAPTDGSELSEQALAVAAQLAQAQAAELLLIRVVPFPVIPVNAGWSAQPAEVYQQILDDASKVAGTELEATATQLRANGTSVRTILYEGSPAAALLDAEQTEQPDVVVMSTHGRSGLDRFALGSVTERMVKEGTRPVLIVRPPTVLPPQLKTALVMLDGSGLAEEVLPLVHTLAQQPLQTIRLFRVVADPDDREAAKHYLDGVASHLAPTGLTCELRVDIGEPRHVVKKATSGVDLVMLCTHGRSGYDRWRHGSVADFVVHHVNRPVLLVRSGAAEEAPDSA